MGPLQHPLSLWWAREESLLQCKEGILIVGPIPKTLKVPYESPTRSSG